MSGKAIQARWKRSVRIMDAKTSEEIWVELLDKTQQYYEGEILLAHSVNELIPSDILSMTRWTAFIY